MEGVGARLGRSSSRYGPATVFTGPVRKWKKKWIHVKPPNGTSSNHHHHSQPTTTNNGNASGNNGSHLLLYKWTPITQRQNDNNNSNGDSAENDAAATEEPSTPRRKFKYIPIAVLEEQKDEAAEQVEDEAKPSETDLEAAEPNSKSDGFDEKPDINDVPVEENQAPDDNPLGRQDLNESTLDLSLGLKSHDGENDSDSRTDQTNGKLERVNSSSLGT